MKQIFLIGLLLTTLVSSSQSINILKEFKALSMHYAELETFSMDISVQYFDESGQQLVQQNGHVLHSSELHYTELAGHTTLINDEYYLSIDTEHQTVVFNQFEKNKKKAKVENTEDISAMIDSMWANQANLKYQIIQSTSDIMRVLFTDETSQYYDSYEITVNRKKHQLKKVIYYYKAQDEPEFVQQVKIQYSNETNRPKLKARHLQVNNYVTKKKGEWIPTEKYKGYHFIDQTKMQTSYE